MTRVLALVGRPHAEVADGRLGPFVDQWAALLTTYRGDATAVRTPVNVVVDGPRILFRTYEQSGKFQRLRSDPRVTLQPCDFRGRVMGDLAVQGVARLLEGQEDACAARAIDAKYPLFQRALVRLGHRLRRYRTVHFAILPSDPVREPDPLD